MNVIIIKKKPSDNMAESRKKKKKASQWVVMNAPEIPNKSAQSIAEVSVKKKVIQKLQANHALTIPEKMWVVEQLELRRKFVCAYHRRNSSNITRKNKKIQTSDEFLTSDKNATSNGNMVKGDVNKCTVTQMMDQTFTKRRDYILRQFPFIINVKELYPLLFSVDQIKKELDRILHRGKCDLFISNIEKYSRNIFHMSKQPLRRIAKHYIDAEDDLGKKLSILQSSSLLLLPKLLNEEPTFVVFKDQDFETTDYPYIEAPSLQDVLTNAKSFTLILEGNTICETVSLSDAVLCMVACFFIFNISYPLAYNATMVMMEKLYLEGKVTEVVPGKVVEIIHAVKTSVL